MPYIQTMADDKPSSRAQNPRRVTVEYTVPVFCQLDLESGRVERVRVLDEELSEAGPVFDRDGHKVTAGEAEQARVLADQAEWPAWEFG